MKNKRIPEQKIAEILKESQTYKGSIRSFCKEKGISEQNFYRWKRLSPQNGAQPPAVKGPRRSVHEENERLKMAIANLYLEHEMLKLAFEKTNGHNR